ncbi:4-hydroxythreonine-4-phosphate dehydrogenase PdxA [Fundidesulfovibrio terrae]|uniref:4-hydroxythreonine-4-phosphate dehydrogenase PdxA n=1 Tax=Fundidesulfovibrio terrae TaxID=2922866 RepID=UPI001FAFAB73|nr:4-hydroxythreonine-4-phosphate dehydrogenase PdxA [Fundidesulfovibrio terrae]
MSQTILLTLGDPNGLGPELVCRWLAANPVISDSLVMIGPEAALEVHARRLGIGTPWKRLDDGLATGEGAGRRNEADAAPDQGRPGTGLDCLEPGMHLLEPAGLESFIPAPGQFSASGGLAAGLSLSLACDLLMNGQASGIVTCPLNKAGLQEAGFNFPGHTEFLAERASVGRDGVCMHLCGPKLRVSLVTTHPPLRLVPELVTREKVLRCLQLTVNHVRRLGLPGPVAVCGLNPHAGESGKIGDEEGRVIVPAMEQARSLGLEVAGPFPADTIFRRAYEGEFPAVLAMYHDQGLAPLKLVHFGEAVNVTLGLPFVRTSVDHGTGYDLVGRDTADMGSFLAALELGRRLIAAG